MAVGLQYRKNKQNSRISKRYDNRYTNVGKKNAQQVGLL